MLDSNDSDDTFAGYVKGYINALMSQPICIKKGSFTNISDSLLPFPRGRNEQYIICLRASSDILPLYTFVMPSTLLEPNSEGKRTFPNYNLLIEAEAFFRKDLLVDC